MQYCLQSIRLYQHTCSRALYIAHVQRCNLLPPHLDVSWPDSPFRDPAYRRVDIDVGPLLIEESQNGLAECVDRSVMATLLNAEPPAPWCEGQSQTLPACVAMRVRASALNSSMITPPDWHFGPRCNATACAVSRARLSGLCASSTCSTSANRRDSPRPSAQACACPTSSRGGSW
jgi:hypothetical protein